MKPLHAAASLFITWLVIAYALPVLPEAYLAFFKVLFRSFPGFVGTPWMLNCVAYGTAMLVLLKIVSAFLDVLIALKHLVVEVMDMRKNRTPYKVIRLWK